MILVEKRPSALFTSHDLTNPSGPVCTYVTRANGKSPRNLEMLSSMIITMSPAFTFSCNLCHFILLLSSVTHSLSHRAHVLQNLLYESPSFLKNRSAIQNFWSQHSTSTPMNTRLHKSRSSRDELEFDLRNFV